MSPRERSDRRPLVAYQGEPGAFSEAVVRKAFARGRPVPMPDFGTVARAVGRGEVEYAVIPVRNSLLGPIAAGRAAIEANELQVIDEIACRIRLCLLGVHGARLEEIREVLSHPIALAQCGLFLSRLPRGRPTPVHDTGGAARLVAGGGDPGLGAVAGRAAARRYHLEVIAADIEDLADNRTHFAVVTGSARRVNLLRSGPLGGTRTPRADESESPAAAGSLDAPGTPSRH